MRRAQKIVALVALLGLFLACGRTRGPAPLPTTPTVVPTARETEPTPVPTETPLPASPQATVIDVINQVDADPLAEGSWQEAVADMAIYERGQVWAKEASTARLGLEEGLLRVAPNTVFTLERPEPDALKLNLDEGQMWINVDGLEEGQTFEVETPSAVASVRGTQFSVRADPGGDVIVSTRAGTVTVSAAASTVVLTAGLQTTVVPGDPPGDAQAMTPEVETWWGMAADDDLNAALPVVDYGNVVTHTGHASHPQVSPDGRYVSYYYYVPENPDAEGPVLHDLQTSTLITGALPADADGITFNPTGGEMAYLRHRTNQICRSNLDGSQASCWGGEVYFGWPHYSPDGQWVLFYSRLGAVGDALNLFKARSDGSDLTQLTSSKQGYNRSPSWSSDGRIAHTYFADYEQPADLWVMNGDGSDHRRVLTSTLWYEQPAWSPDGSALAVAGYGEGQYGQGGGLWMVPLNGKDPWMVPGTEGWTCYGLSWTPWNALFFKAYGEGVRKGIYWTVPGGPARQAPTFFSNAYTGPVWSADRSSVAFAYTYGEKPDVWTAVHVYPVELEFAAPFTSTLD